MILRNSSSAPGASLEAIAPIFHITARPASRSVVPMSRNRPFWYSPATAARTSGVTYFAMRRANGALSAMPSLIYSRQDATPAKGVPGSHRRGDSAQDLIILWTQECEWRDQCAGADPGHQFEFRAAALRAPY